MTYLVGADNIQDALDEFGDYCKEKGFDGFLSEEQENEEDFPVNGGEVWLQVPDHIEEIRNRFQYNFTYYSNKGLQTEKKNVDQIKDDLDQHEFDFDLNYMEIGGSKEAVEHIYNYLEKLNDFLADKTKVSPR